MNHPFPPVHPDPFVDTTRPYITGVVEALLSNGIRVQHSWLDPSEPRDATIRFLRAADSGSLTISAAVWDEETGWRVGGFVSGRPGMRTILSRSVSLGGGLLPRGSEVARRTIQGVSAHAAKYRSRLDNYDGFEAELHAAGARMLVQA